jgi:hypothetical protein
LEKKARQVIETTFKYAPADEVRLLAAATEYLTHLNRYVSWMEVAIRLHREGVEWNPGPASSFPGWEGADWACMNDTMETTPLISHSREQRDREVTVAIPAVSIEIVPLLTPVVPPLQPVMANRLPNAQEAVRIPEPLISDDDDEDDDLDLDSDDDEVKEINVEQPLVSQNPGCRFRATCGVTSHKCLGCGMQYTYCQECAEYHHPCNEAHLPASTVNSMYHQNFAAAMPPKFYASCFHNPRLSGYDHNIYFRSTTQREEIGPLDDIGDDSLADVKEGESKQNEQPKKEVVWTDAYVQQRIAEYQAAKVEQDELGDEFRCPLTSDESLFNYPRRGRRRHNLIETKKILKEHFPGLIDVVKLPLDPKFPTQPSIFGPVLCESDLDEWSHKTDALWWQLYDDYFNYHRQHPSDVVLSRGTSPNVLSRLTDPVDPRVIYQRSVEDAMARWNQDHPRSDQFDNTLIRGFNRNYCNYDVPDFVIHLMIFFSSWSIAIATILAAFSLDVPRKDRLLHDPLDLSRLDEYMAKLNLDPKNLLRGFMPTREDWRLWCLQEFKYDCGLDLDQLKFKLLPYDPMSGNYCRAATDYNVDLYKKMVLIVRVEFENRFTFRWLCGKVKWIGLANLWLCLVALCVAWSAVVFSLNLVYDTIVFGFSLFTPLAWVLFVILCYLLASYFTTFWKHYFFSWFATRKVAYYCPHLVTCAVSDQSPLGSYEDACRMMVPKMNRYGCVGLPDALKLTIIDTSAAIATMLLKKSDFRSSQPIPVPGMVGWVPMGNTL